MKKKFLAVILTAVLSVSMIPAIGVAAEEKTVAEAPDQISVSTPTPSVTEPTVTPVPEDTEDPISTPAPTQVPKKINVKWTAFRWTSHTSAVVTLRANVNGKCYFSWAERKSNGTSNVPYISAKSPNVLIKADQNFVIYLNDLNTDEELEAFRNKLTDRFGPIPKEGEELMCVVALRSLGKSLGVEHLVIKKGRMTLNFVSNKDSAFYQSVTFVHCINYATQHYQNTILNEMNGKRRMQIKGVNTVAEGVAILKEMCAC